MQYTSAEAAKLLRKLNEEHDYLLSMEDQSKEFLVSTLEEPESVRPAYDYAQMQAKLTKLEKDIRTVRHAISTFNLTHEVPGFNMTVDQMLVYLPQLTARRNKLYRMKDRLPKTRERAVGVGNNALIEYNYANYDIAEAEKDYAFCEALLARAQTALDLLNTRETMEIEL